MIEAHENAIVHLFGVSKEHVALLSQMEQLTDQLMNAVRSKEVDLIEELLTSRENLCTEIGRSSSILGGLIRGLENIQSEDTAWQGVRLAISQIQGMRDSVLTKQSQCEALLAARLGECRAELADLRQREGARTAYAKPAAADQQARFLDSRL